MDRMHGLNSEGQKKEVAISVAIHSILIMLIVFLPGHCVKKPPELTTIFLDNGKLPPVRPDRAGGDGRKAGSEGMDKKAAKGAFKPMIERTTRSVRDKTVSARFPTEADLKSGSIRRTDILPETAPGPAENPDYTALKGVGEGLGGGGGKGIGAYGGGSGLGGTGRDGMGDGSGKGVGVSRRAEVDRYLKEHYSYIRDLILKHLVYPSMAKKMGWEGKVMVSFTISEKGMAGKLKVVESSGYRVLDENVVDTIKGVEPFPKPPVPAPIEIPIKYSLDKM